MNDEKDDKNHIECDEEPDQSKYPNIMKNLTIQNNDQTEHNEEPDHLKERLLLSVLPRHVAMEMKADIAGSVHNFDQKLCHH